MNSESVITVLGIIMVMVDIVVRLLIAPMRRGPLVWSMLKALEGASDAKSSTKRKGSNNV